MEEKYFLEFKKLLSSYSEELLWGRDDTRKDILNLLNDWAVRNLDNIGFEVFLKLSDIFLSEGLVEGWTYLVDALKVVENFSQYKIVMEQLINFHKTKYSGERFPYERAIKTGYMLAREREDYQYLFKILENKMSLPLVLRVETILENKISVK